MNNVMSRYWLLAALVFAFIPHVERLPWWLNGVMCVMLLCMNIVAIVTTCHTH